MATAALHSRYSRVSMWLHWSIALLIIGNLTAGIALSQELLPKALEPTAIGLHQSFGLTIMALSLVRLGWRASHPFVPFPAQMAGWEKLLARSTHILFYVLIIAIPLTGWAMSSANPQHYPIPYFWLFDMPALPVAVSGTNAHRFNTVHGYLAYGTLALLALHVAGALKHRYFDRDDVLAHMVPGARRGG